MVLPNINALADSPSREAARLQALQQYELLDTSAEQELDELTELASQLCGVPISLITLVAEKRQWFKSKVGLDLSETPRTVSFCHHAITDSQVFEVMDARTDYRFQDNPLVTGNPNIRFYAGMPLITPQGHALGTLCIIDTEPRILTIEQRQALEVLARQVMLHFELRRSRLEREKEKQKLYQVLAELQQVKTQVENLPAAAGTQDRLLALQEKLENVVQRLETLASA
ncbi:GAF domain-containing protein [Rufibacter immobilis]|uniref:GAF domain-containing protein n=1 Tax=Rufibacter immobilis TaxID=1348778 RepID=A0A3M9MWF4_9BACT|nr:GAF domain-containing protein [Rufibacter immobilis]RNI29810.1 GAF domain-containing protein [Rufibacter immobilis]